MISMKAIILAAGYGKRMRPYTDNTPKPLLKVGDKTIMEMMINNLVGVGLREIAIVTGYLEEKIRVFVKSTYPDLAVTFIPNKKYLITNTGYSLMLTKDWVGEDSFVKCDGDVVFEKAIMEKLVGSPHQNCLCVDSNIDLEAEEVKVKVDKEGRALEVGKKVSPQEAIGESIGIEKISEEAGKALFRELGNLMRDPKNHQEYYDDSYTTLVAKGIPFHVVNITGLRWVEIDTVSDYELAKKFFGGNQK